MKKQNPIKRFVAGAVCPSCAQMDKLVMYEVDKQQVRECVRCGYQDVMTDAGPQKIEEITTRVNKLAPGEAPLAHEDEVQLLNIVDFNSGAKRRDH